MMKIWELTKIIFLNLIKSARGAVLKPGAKPSVFSVLRDRYIFWPVVLNFILMAFNFFYLLIKIKTREPLIPLHYNLYFGVDLIGNKYEILKLPLVGLVILFLNFFLSSIFFRREKLVSYFLTFFSLLAALIIISASRFILNI